MTIKLATPKEAADALRTTEASLAQDRYRKTGLPYVKAGKRVLYQWSDIQAYLDANTVTPGAA